MEKQLETHIKAFVELVGVMHMENPKKYYKIRLSGGSLRGPTKNAECKDLPKVGQPFRCVAEPFEGGICRLIETTSVVTIVPDGFVTASGSLYWLELE